MRAAWLTLLPVGVLLFSAPRPGVAPWDTYDGPNPDPILPRSAPLVSTPSNLVQASGDQATLPNGTTVELLSIARRRWDREDRYRSPLPDAQPVWRPDGAAYLGDAPDEHPIHNAISRHPTGELMRKDGKGMQFDDKGARYLTFRLKGTPNASLDLVGFVPETARQGETNPEAHGRDLPLKLRMPEDGRVDYETEVVVDDRAAGHYRIGVATGEWKKADSIPFDHSKFGRFPTPDSPTGKIVLAKGEWGTLILDMRDFDRLRGARGYSGPGPQLYFVFRDSEPQLLATQLRFIDALGKSELLDRLRPWNEFRPVRIEIETRPYDWIEFSNVHYDPDSTKWPKGYWGDEGNATIRRKDGAELRAIVAPTPSDRGLVATRVYAVDGKPWRAYPDPSSLSWPWIYSKEESEGLIAALNIDPVGEQGKDWNLVQAFASVRDTPGIGLGEPLSGVRGGRGITRVPFRRPATKYVQFQINDSLPWKKVGEIAPPSESRSKAFFLQALREHREPRDQDGNPMGVVVATVTPEGYGQVQLGGEAIGRSPLHWKINQPDTRSRIVLRMKSGVRYVASDWVSTHLPEQAAGTWFNLNRNGEAVYHYSEGYPAKQTDLFLRDVEAFEFETQDFAPAIFLVGKVPRSE